MFKQFLYQNGGQNQSGWPQAQPQPHQDTSFNKTLSSQTDYWLSQISVRLSGRLAAAPVVEPNGKAGKVELTFLATRGFDTFGAKSFQNGSYTGTSERILVWCSSWQFARVAQQVTPQTCLEIQGKPLAAIDKAGKPQLVIVCSDLKITGSGRFGALFSGKTRLGASWALIFGAILLLQILLPRLVPPGLLPLAILLGGMRFVEELEVVPDNLKRVIRRYLVKILLFAAFVAAIWCFVQYSYYTTVRFR